MSSFGSSGSEGGRRRMAFGKEPETGESPSAAGSDRSSTVDPALLKQAASVGGEQYRYIAFDKYPGATRSTESMELKEGEKKKVAEAVPSQVAAWVWEVPDSVPVLPEHYHVARTASFVENIKNPTIVSNRISNVLYRLNLEVQLNPEKPNQLTVVCADATTFCIKLFRGKKDYSHGIIVEVSPRYNTSNMTFTNTSRAVLRAAQDKRSAIPIKSDVISLPGSFVGDEEDEDDDEQDARQVSSTSSLSSAEEIAGAAALLKPLSEQLSPRAHRDAQLHALQTLTSVTNPNAMGRSVATCVSRAILEGQGSSSSRMLKNMILLLTDSDDPTMETSASASSATKSSSTSTSLTQQLMTMTLLSQVMTNVPAREVPTSLATALYPKLLIYLRDAPEHPQLAFLAARCVEVILSLGDGIVERSELGELLQTSIDIGSLYHVALYRQADICIRKMKAETVR